MKMKTVVILLLLTMPALGFSDVPVRAEQLIYTVLAFNGKDYSATFAPSSSDTIYLLTGVDNFLSARKTLVYFWPITGEWKTDLDNLDMFFPGILELRQSGRLLQQIPLESYTYFNVRGEYELNWKVAVGDAAAREFERYVSLSATYFKADSDYQKSTIAYQAEIQRLAEQIQQLRQAGKNFAGLLDRLKTLPRPEQPQPPRDYVVPPQPPIQAFRLNLPRGEYRIRLINPDGTLMEGSEKSIVVHERRRANGVGFEVIPSDKWTRPEESKTPGALLYVNGSADLYLRAFYEDEFNDLDYAKTVDSGAKGNPNMYEWIRIQQVPHSTIELREAQGSLLRLTEHPYYVEQTKGTTLGYNIVPFGGQGSQKDKEPNLIAFRVPISKGGKVLGLRLLNAESRPLPGSERQIRIVRRTPAGMIFILLTLVPVLALGIVLRARTYSS